MGKALLLVLTQECYCLCSADRKGGSGSYTYASDLLPGRVCRVGWRPKKGLTRGVVCPVPHGLEINVLSVVRGRSPALSPRTMFSCPHL